MGDWWLAIRIRAVKWLVGRPVPDWLVYRLVEYLFRLWAVERRRGLKRRYGTETPELRAKR